MYNSFFIHFSQVYILLIFSKWFNFSFVFDSLDIDENEEKLEDELLKNVEFVKKLSLGHKLDSKTTSHFKNLWQNENILRKSWIYEIVTKFFIQPLSEIHNFLV